MALKCATCGESNLDTSSHCRVCQTPLQQLLYALPPGTKLQGGKYIIEKVLGEGGFGITYQATDGKRAIAIKELFPRGSARQPNFAPILPAGRSKSWFDRTCVEFLEEVSRLLPFENRNIVRVYDCFLEHETAYMVMELIKGRNLSVYVRARGPLAPPEALKFLAQIGIALELLHRGGLVHRDIKSENILIDDKQRAVLIDFGSMQPSAEEVSNTEFSVVSHGFSPPELYQYQHHYTAAVDIYGLAATAYNLLTGQVPTAAPDRLKGFPIESIRTFNKLVSNQFEQVILKGLSLDPNQRPASTMALIRELVTNDTSTPIMPPSRTQARPIVPPLKPNPPPALPLPRTIRFMGSLEGHNTPITALAFSPDGRLLVSSSSERIRFWEIASARKLFTLNDEKLVNTLQFTPDGQGVLIGTVQGALRLWQMTTGKTISCCPVSGVAENRPLQTALSRNGRWWAVLGIDQQITLWETGSSQPIRHQDTEKIGVKAMALSAQGEFFALVRVDGKVRVRRTLDGEILGIHSSAQHAIKNLTFDPLQSRLFLTDIRGGLTWWNWQEGQEQLLHNEGPVSTDLRVFAQQPLLILTFGIDPYWQFWSPSLNNAQLWMQTRASTLPPSAIRTLALHPHEATIATAHSDGKIRIWQV